VRIRAAPYRSLRFEDTELPIWPYQPMAVVNYPNEHEFARIIERAHLHRARDRQHPYHQGVPRPEEYLPRDNETYYPVPAESSRLLYKRFVALRAEVARTVIFAPSVDEISLLQHGSRRKPRPAALQADKLILAGPRGKVSRRHTI